MNDRGDLVEGRRRPLRARLAKRAAPGHGIRGWQAVAEDGGARPERIKGHDSGDVVGHGALTIAGLAPVALRREREHGLVSQTILCIAERDRTSSDAQDFADNRKVSVLDRWGRPLGHLRISVTDRCNLRCAYCMPEDEYVWLPRPDLLTFEELTRVTRIVAGLGVEHVRLTGGEPLLRKGLSVLVEAMARLDGIRDLAMTTNGVLLGEAAAPLHDAGLSRVTVSLDTLDRDRFTQLTRRNDLPRVVAGITAARDAFGTLKLDTVLMRGINDDELVPLVAFAREVHAEIRFIEYMDVPGATRWSPALVVSQDEMLARLHASYGSVEALPPDGPAPAGRFRLPHGQIVGIIASTTRPFCDTCDRLRLTADGQLFFCLYGTRGLDLRTPLRQGASDEALAALIAGAWQARGDRGAEHRASIGDRSAFIATDVLRTRPHLEMHTRGG